MSALIEQEPWVTVARVIGQFGGKVINLSAHSLQGDFRDKDQREKCAEALKEGVPTVRTSMQHTFLYVDRL
jgi:hypothetical protein